MPHAFTQTMNPKCIHCGLNAHHLTPIILEEPCPVKDALPDLPPLEEVPSVIEPLDESASENLDELDKILDEANRDDEETDDEDEEA